MSITTNSEHTEILSPEAAVSKGVSKNFEVKFNCKDFMATTGKYYQDVIFHVKDTQGETTGIDLQYKVICDKERLYGVDLSMLILFGIAVVIIWIAHHTPPLMLLDDATEEEINETAVTSSNAVGFAVCASLFLLTLYLII